MILQITIPLLAIFVIAMAARELIEGKRTIAAMAAILAAMIVIGYIATWDDDDTPVRLSDAQKAQMLP